MEKAEKLLAGNRRAQDINRNGAGYALQQMQIDHAPHLGVALPWERNPAEDWKDGATLCAADRGGQIMVPTPGIYEDVAASDLSGYYPTSSFATTSPATPSMASAAPMDRSSLNSAIMSARKCRATNRRSSGASGAIGGG